ncbi:MAG: hypothetical protein IJF84_10505 [Thermoguttaceae bacterium]|nr:hypothetical protein [Thermoguttaceae bacterium]
MPFEFTSTPSGTGSTGFNTANGSGNTTANLSEIASSLDKINGLMDEAKKQLTNHLLQEEKKASAAPAASAPVDLSPLKTMIQSVLTRLDEMGSKIGQNTGSAAAGAPNPNAAAKQDVADAVTHVSGLFDTQNHNLQVAFNALDSKITDAVNYLVANLKGSAAPAQPVTAAPVAETPKPAPAPQPEPQPAPQQHAPVIQTVVNKVTGGISRDQLMKIILGQDLCSIGSLSVYRDELLDGFLRGDRASAGLIGAMIEFQSSTPERMPRLLQDIGEAYYRWHPKRGQGADPFERALAQNVCALCEANGIKNTIELVETGQRFDSGRHNSNSRGVEITEVKGWVVLRDNGKVYTRAAVEVQ